MANYVRALVSKASMPCDDNTQANVRAAKDWLDAIISGALVVRSAQRI